MHLKSLFFFFFNDTATTEIYTLSLHDALPISRRRQFSARGPRCPACRTPDPPETATLATPAEQTAFLPQVSRKRDRKSTRLNSSHGYISYAVFCLKKKKKTDS